MALAGLALVATAAAVYFFCLGIFAGVFDFVVLVAEAVEGLRPRPEFDTCWLLLIDPGSSYFTAAAALAPILAVLARVLLVEEAACFLGSSAGFLTGERAEGDLEASLATA